MAQHPILLGTVQTYKIIDVPSSAQRIGKVNSQPLNFYVISSWCNVFCLSLFLTSCVDHLCANPGCAILPFCQQLCHEHKSPVQKGRMCLWSKNSNSCTHQNVIMTRNTGRVRNELFLPLWCPGITVLSIRRPKEFFARIWVECRRPKHTYIKSSYFSATEFVSDV